MENEWIKVSDRLPVDGEEVIVFWNKEVVSGIQYFDGSGFCPFDGCGNYNQTTTHWMPLPKPPTE